MISLVAISLVVAPVAITGARPVAAGERVRASGIRLACELPLGGEKLNVAADMAGEIAGTGNGPLRLTDAGSRVVLRSMPGSISYDETLPVGQRKLFVELPNRLSVGSTRYFARLRFDYLQDAAAPTSIDNPAHVRNARLAVFEARHIVSSNGLHYEKSPKVRPLAISACRTLIGGNLSQGTAQ